MRQWCLTLFDGYRDWLSSFLKSACRFATICSEFTGATIRRYVYGVAWSQACDQLSAEMFSVSSCRIGTCEVVGA